METLGEAVFIANDSNVDPEVGIECKDAFKEECDDENKSSTSATEGVPGLGG
jgi:hypothetical protein